MKKLNFWDKIAGLYDIAESFNGKVYRQMTQTAASLVPEGATVLDCAGGTGALSVAAAAKAQKVLCTDYSEKMLFQARKKAAKRKLSNISFEKRDIYFLKDGSEVYDIVIAGNVLHLLDNPQDAVKELYRVTKKGGKLLLPTFITGDTKLLSIKLYKLLGFSPAHEYTEKEYINMLKSCKCGSIKAKTIRGTVPCCFAVIEKQ